MTKVDERADHTAREGVKLSSRIGLVAYGVLHLLVAWVAVELALDGGPRESSGQGAMRQLAAQPLGRWLVGAIAVGMAGFCAGRAVEGCLGHRDEKGADRWKHRAVAWGKAVVYAVISASAAEIALGSSGGGSSKERSMSGRVMDLPGGQVVMVLVGVGFLALGVRHCYRAFTQDFHDELSAGGRDGRTGTVYLAFGQVGYAAKGVVIGLVGVLVGYAGLTHDPQKSGGVDSALQTVRDQPFGPVLLCAVAAGIASYGLFCFARARHLSKGVS